MKRATSAKCCSRYVSVDLKPPFSAPMLTFNFCSSIVVQCRLTERYSQKSSVLQRVGQTGSGAPGRI